MNELFILMYWNGEHYEDSEEEVVGVFTSFAKAQAGAFERASREDDNGFDPESESEQATYYIHRQPVDTCGLEEHVWSMRAHEIRRQI